MSRKAVAQLQDTAAWTATTSTGQPTTRLTAVADAARRLGTPVGAIEAAAPVVGDRVEAAIAPLDLRELDDLELWVQADRPADGSDAAPWYLELRLGSAGRPIGAAANTWQRFLPLRADGSWEPVIVGMADLPGAVRQAVNAARFTCVDASRPFRCAIDGPWAVRASAIADVDDALRGLLHEVLTLDGTPVPLAFRPGPAPAPPALRARQTTTRLRPDLATAGERRTDFSGGGLSLRPAAVPVEVGYELTPEADDRAGQAAVLEFALTTLATTNVIDVAGRPATLQVVEPRPDVDVDDLPMLSLSILTSLRPGAPPAPAVPPFNRIEVEVDDLARA